MPIYFYRVNEVPYGCFSNFSPHSFKLDGILWPTSEHYFQAQKVVDTPLYEMILKTKSPMRAAELGRNRQYPIRPDWDAVKDEVMKRAVRAKFASHAEIRAILLETGSKLLVEKTTNDYYWGCGSDGTGKNRLGLILMDVREELRAQLRGQEVMQIYRDAAIRSHQAAFALAQRCKELFDSSGEPPRAEYFDEVLILALKNSYDVADAGERLVIGWLLEHLKNG